MPVLGAIVGVLAGVFAAAQILDRGVHAPNVLRMRERVAREQILHTMPTASVSVVRVYSTRVAPGRVVRQRPRPDAKLQRGVEVTLLVSKGTPFAQVPSIASGTAPETAKANLERSGFAVRYRWTPSWYVRKGTVVELSPGAGMRVRRPATVRIVISTGWPRQVVPDLAGFDVEAAKQELVAKHLRYGIVYRRTQTAVADQVLAQKPAAGDDGLPRHACLDRRRAESALDEGLLAVRLGCVRERSVHRSGEVAHPLPARRGRLLRCVYRARVDA